MKDIKINKGNIKSFIWYFHWVNFLLVVGAWITVDANGCIFSLPEYLSYTIFILMCIVGFALIITLFIFERKKYKLILVFLSALIYILMLFPGILASIIILMDSLDIL